MTLTRSQNAALSAATNPIVHQLAPPRQPAKPEGPREKRLRAHLYKERILNKLRQSSRVLACRAIENLGPKVSEFLSSHGPTCTVGCEASFTVEALNYVRSRWTTGPTKGLTLAAAARLCVMDGDGLARYFKGRAGGKLTYRCALCDHQRPCEIADVLKHVGEEHASPDEKGMEWELQSWPMELPIRGVGKAWKMSKRAQNRNLRKQWDNNDEEVGHEARRIRIKIIFKIPKDEEPEPVDDDEDDFDQEIYDMFEEARNT